MWWFYTWNEGTAGEGLSRRPYRCKSWRCRGECQRKDAAITFRRIQQAFEPFAADSVCFLVLTLDRDGTHNGEGWPDTETAYRELARMCRLLLKRLRRRWPDIGSHWVAIPEAHRSGWPHVNLLIASPMLAAFLRGCKPDASGRCVVRGDLWAQVVESGWGLQSTAEVARSPDALAGYIAKLSGDIAEEGRRGGVPGATSGEVVKLSQVPYNAPKGFRRLRSGRGFLPPRYPGRPGRTGRIVEACGRSARVIGHRPRAQDRATKTASYKALFDAVGRAREAERLASSIGPEPPRPGPRVVVVPSAGQRVPPAGEPAELRLVYGGAMDTDKTSSAPACRYTIADVERVSDAIPWDLLTPERADLFEGMIRGFARSASLPIRRGPGTPSDSDWRMLEDWIDRALGLRDRPFCKREGDALRIDWRRGSGALQVYWDELDPDAVGWSYALDRGDGHTESGALDSWGELEDMLSRA